MLTLGLMPLVRKIQARSAIRWILVSVFLFLIFGVGNSIEDSIHSSTKGITLMIPILLLPCIVMGTLLTLLFRPLKATRFSTMVSEFFRGRTANQWIWGILLSAVLFPIVYFIFGSIISPIVIEYYRSGIADLVLPAPITIVAVELLRGFLFVLATIPLLIAWLGSRRHMIFFLGLAFFVLTGTFEIVMAYQLPAQMRVIHSVEILADSFIYAWSLVLLLSKEPTNVSHGDT